MNYADVSTFTDLHDLVLNRVGLCNELLGCRYHCSMSNPVRLVSGYGRYSILVCGEVIAEFKPYDVISTRSAYERIDGLYNGLWFLRRSQSIN